MELFPSRTTFLRIGNITIQWYAVLILTGAFVAYYFSKRNLKEYRNIDINGFFDDMFVYMLWAGIIGARLWFCVFNNFTYYFSNPVQILRIWDGGVAFHGAFAGGLIAVLLMCRKRNVSVLKFMDAVLPTVLFAQGLGRWGNFINQECHGGEVAASYFDGILSFLKSGMYIGGHYYEPLFFFESSLCIIGFVLINFILRKYQNKRGDLAYAYLIWYGVVRFFIEGRRTDSLYFGSLRTAQLTSIVYVIVGFCGFIGLFEKWLNKKKPTLVFDFDGTLANSEDAIIASFAKVFEKRDRLAEFTEERKIKVLGPPIRDMFVEFIPEEDPDALCNEYREYNKEFLKQKLKPMANALELIDHLKNNGYDMGILTTRTLESTKECIRICGFDPDAFKEIIALESVEHTKPDPEGIFKFVNGNKLNSSDVVMIGDSIADVGAGQNYGAYTIAFVYNEGKREELAKTGPNKLIDDLSDIELILNEDHYFTYNLK